MATVEDILLPDIGEFADVEIIEILVAPGDRIEPEQSLLTLESDKASMEIPSPLGGEVTEINVRVGERVGLGHLLLRVDTSADDGAAGSNSAEGADSGADSVSAAASSSASEAKGAPAAEPATSGTGATATGANATASTANKPASTASAKTGNKQAAAATNAASTEQIEVPMPDIGDFTDIPVIEVLVGIGDQVEVDQSIVTLESEKATMEIPSPAAGTVDAVHIKTGDKVNQGDLLLTLKGAAQASVGDGPDAPSAEEAETAQAPAATAKPEVAQAQPEATSASESTQAQQARSASRAPGEAERRKAPILPRPADMQAIASGRTPHASPAIRRFARELGVDLAQVKGSGRKGRILKDDVQGYVKKTLSAGGPPAAAGGMPFQLPAAPEVDFSKFGQIETQPLSRIKKLSGTHLHRAWLSVPHVTQFDEADITELEAFRKGQKQAAEQAGVKLTFMPFLMKAVAGALVQMPTLKASLSPDGDNLILKQYTHIGVAVDTPNGLVVPVIRDVDKKGLFEIARELMTLSGKARDGKLLPGDMQGGVFSISSLGGIGGTAFTPIVNAPEVAILGVSRTEMKPVWNADSNSFEPRLMLPLSLSYDHRVVDGADGVRFTTLLAGLLSDIRRLLL
ncbi:dihydrolipoyllysine-residue acetyltransferase [Lamprobacter modestohalophilus]|uniref:dihydrolipoyllysine-residue acetyltransferase n=1 Tax=Lamprobacter modestohalophilus TaxID=1064514 RepID=UPI002ADEAB47|nr:dihydrolipoyllysine-residue acetyltransferase [Lamprobacter modestohalophilus]MEA1048224.1 dihydrolipoyllysine-residue acetyltransferase [Lamprobacter modestohalophilus]